MVKFGLNLPCWKYEIRTEISQSHPNWSSLEKVEIKLKFVLKLNITFLKSALIGWLAYKIHPHNFG